MESDGIALESIELDGLFGKPRFSLQLDPERPTIVTGANGTGKSTILRLVSALSNGEVMTLANAPLDELKLNFRNGPALIMSRNKDRSGFELEWGEHRGEIAVAPAFSHLPDLAIQLLEEASYDIEEAFEKLIEMGPTASGNYNEYTTARELMRELREKGPVLAAPEWLADYGSGFPVLYISDQRLVTEGMKRRRGAPFNPRTRVTSGLAVETASRMIAREIDAAFSRYGQMSQQLDRRFQQQVIRAIMEHTAISETQLELLAEEVEAKRASLAEVGLLENESQGFEFAENGFNDPEVRPVLNAVLSTTLKKLRVFDGLEKRLSALKTFLDTRFATKSLTLSRSEGMRFSSADVDDIRPRQLSSGEQQLTVLAYEILFRADPGTLVIIDEPELSLHVLWQDYLVDDLTKMGEISNLQFLMATHSPTIVAEHPELERALAGLQR
jgi:predicted ATPase